MINYKALFDVTYGMYLVCAGDKNHSNAYISNSVFQVSSSPALFAASCNKLNYTAGFIEKHNSYSVSVLSQDTDTAFFTALGYKSGKGIQKLQGLDIQYGATGTPVVLNNSIAYLECRLTQKIDLGTHWLFIGELIEARQTNPAGIPMTYAYYREAKKALSPSHSPTFIEESQLNPPPPVPDKKTEAAENLTESYKCSVCGYVYSESEEGQKFSELPEDWVCPVCGTEKEEFVKF